MTWNTQRISLLKQLWGDGQPASQIAIILGGVTKNAVIGKVHRLNLPCRTTHSRTARLRARPSSAPRRITRARRQAREADSSCIPELEPPPPVQPGIRELTGAHCRWPEGDPKHAGFHFCGRTKLPGSSYCPHHHARAFTPIKRRKRPSLPEPAAQGTAEHAFI